ncbi:hypothetical protein LY78DRAFT_174478 [Colletotrichum sublineola]|nr:hypothetical protein LY78DRAFT_174478 [Colletotrichum sublineola]
MGIVPAAIARSPSLSAFSAQDPESPGGAHGDSTAPLFLDAGTDGGASCFDVESGRRPPSTNNNNSNHGHGRPPLALLRDGPRWGRSSPGINVGGDGRWRHPLMGVVEIALHPRSQSISRYKYKTPSSSLSPTLLSSPTHRLFRSFPLSYSFRFSAPSFHLIQFTHSFID